LAPTSRGRSHPQPKACWGDTIIFAPTRLKKIYDGRHKTGQYASGKLLSFGDRKQFNAPKIFGDSTLPGPAEGVYSNPPGPLAGFIGDGKGEGKRKGIERGKKGGEK